MIVVCRPHSMRKSLASASAYTMPELLITILLLSILFTLSIIFSSGLGQSRRLRDYSVAVALAQQAIEIARSAPFKLLDDADAGKDSLEIDLNTSTGENDPFLPEIESGGITYDRKVEITDVMALEDKERPIGLKLFTVTVNWKTLDGGKPDPFIVTTTIADMN
ncbi:MAG: hypothetical protein ACD_39C00932G0003 [uncultured bacterium]|nr:MAG: hypothetical protein ACD_39C00932G0003 [uncultured bacterium]